MSGATPGPGDLLNDRYRLRRPIGRGGMAHVFEALDERLGRPVAVKVLGGAPHADIERFAAEVATLAVLDHPNIVRLLDAGDLGRGLAFLVMELVAGESLGARLKAGPLPATEVARIGAAVATGLAYVHARGVVHRDVKPGNILLGPDERVRLADFGIARLVDTGGLTVTGVVLGTPAYLSPEQVTGRIVGPAADLYALGLVLAECATGRRVFDGSGAEVAAARVHAAPLALEGVPEPLRAALVHFTDPDPLARPGAAEAAALLTPLAGAPPDPAFRHAPSPVLGAETKTLPLTTAPTLVRMPTPPASRRPRPALVAAGAVLCCFGAGFGIASALSAAPAPAALSAARRPRVPTTTTTAAASSPLHRAAAAFDGALRAGVSAGRVAAPARRTLASDLHALLAAPATRPATLRHLGADLSAAVAAHQVTGVSATALSSAVDALAGALGVAPPVTSAPPTTTSTTTTVPPRPSAPATTAPGPSPVANLPPGQQFPPGNFGPGHGKGHKD